MPAATTTASPLLMCTDRIMLSLSGKLRVRRGDGFSCRPCRHLAGSFLAQRPCQKSGYSSETPKFTPYRGVDPFVETFQNGSTKQLTCCRPILNTRPEPKSRGNTCFPVCQSNTICGCDLTNHPLPS